MEDEGVRWPRTAGEVLFLGVCVSTFPEETRIWLGRLNKDCPHSCEQTPSSPWRPQIVRAWEGHFSSLREIWDSHLLLPLDVSAPGSQAFGTGLNYASASQPFSL
jgi:hypothetical protein